MFSESIVAKSNKNIKFCYVIDGQLLHCCDLHLTKTQLMFTGINVSERLSKKNVLMTFGNRFFDFIEHTGLVCLVAYFSGMIEETDMN